jgi:hypothetical protein
LIGCYFEISLFLVPKEGTLDCVDERNMMKAEQNVSSGKIAAPFKPIGVVVEPRIIFANHHREYFNEIVQLFGMVSVKESA